MMTLDNNTHCTEGDAMQPDRKQAKQHVWPAPDFHPLGIPRTPSHPKTPTPPNGPPPTALLIKKASAGGPHIPRTPPPIIGRIMRQLCDDHPSCEVVAKPSPFGSHGWAICVGPCEVEMPPTVLEMIGALEAFNLETRAVFSERSDDPDGWAISFGGLLVLPPWPGIPIDRSLIVSGNQITSGSNDNHDDDPRQGGTEHDDGPPFDHEDRFLDSHRRDDNGVVVKKRFITLGHFTYDRDTNQRITNRHGRMHPGIADDVVTAFGNHLMASNPDLHGPTPGKHPLAKCGACGHTYKRSVTILKTTNADGDTTQWCRQCVDLWDDADFKGSSSLNFLLCLRT